MRANIRSAGSSLASWRAAALLLIALVPRWAFADESGGIPIASTDLGWSAIAASGGPGPRNGGRMVYATGRNSMILVGGYNGAYLNEVWELRLASPGGWANITPSSGPIPSGRSDFACVYDPVRNSVWIAEGSDGAQYLNEVWELSLGGVPSWTHHTPSGTPPSPRRSAAAVLDTGADRMILFGGYPYSNELWSLSLSSSPAWTPLGAGGTPPSPRQGVVAAFDATTDRLIVFGGDDAVDFQNDLWAISLSGVSPWRHLLPSGPLPPKRRFAAGCLDPVSRSLTVFGGGNASGYLQDTWKLNLDGNAWTNMTSVAGLPPSSRFDAFAAYQPCSRKMYLFGGYGGSGTLGDFWSYYPGLVNTPAVPRPPGDRGVQSVWVTRGVGDSLVVHALTFAQGPEAGSPSDVSYQIDVRMNGNLVATTIVPHAGIANSNVCDWNTDPFRGYSQDCDGFCSLDLVCGLWGCLNAPPGCDPICQCHYEDHHVWPLPGFLAERFLVSVRPIMGSDPDPQPLDDAASVLVASLPAGPVAWDRAIDTIDFSPQCDGFTQVHVRAHVQAMDLTHGTDFSGLLTLTVNGVAADTLTAHCIVSGGPPGNSCNFSYPFCNGTCPNTWTITPSGIWHGPQECTYAKVATSDACTCEATLDWIANVPALRSNDVVAASFVRLATAATETDGTNDTATVTYRPGAVADEVLPGGHEWSDRGLWLAPNPFVGRTLLRFSLNDDGNVRARVYDVAGRVVRQLLEGNIGRGPHAVAWDGLDQQGARLPAGIYFVRVNAGHQVLARSVVMLK
jgi:hypothetical protein